MSYMKSRSFVQLTAVLLDKTLRPIGELINGVVVPPGVQITILVKLAALIIQSVSELMADGGANVAVVDGERKVRVVER